VSYEVESPDGGLTVIVAPNGECQMTRTGGVLPGEEPGDSEIGSYHSQLEAGVPASLRDLVTGLLDERTGKLEPLRPGTLSLTFGYLAERKAPRARSFPRNRPLPPSAQRANERMGEIVTEMRKHPVQTLKASAAWEHPELSRNQEIKVRVTLRNSGTMPIGIRNPAAATEDSEIGLQVLIEKDVPPDEMTMLDQAAPVLTKSDVTQVSAPGAKEGSPPSPIVKLEPEQKLVLSVTIRSHLYLGPGRYRGVVNYQSMTEGIPKQEAVPGRLSIPTGRLGVTAR
jgi:hypothetical protein